MELKKIHQLYNNKNKLSNLKSNDNQTELKQINY